MRRHHEQPHPDTLFANSAIVVSGTLKGKGQLILGNLRSDSTEPDKTHELAQLDQILSVTHALV